MAYGYDYYAYEKRVMRQAKQVGWVLILSSLAFFAFASIPYVEPALWLRIGIACIGFTQAVMGLWFLRRSMQMQRLYALLLTLS